MKRYVVTLMILGILSGFAASAEARVRSQGKVASQKADTHEATRSGSILTGSAFGLIGGEPSGCELMVDCRAWLESGCDSHLAGRNPALMTSIEDVESLARRTRMWTLRHDPGAAAYATVQLWSQDCTQIGSAISRSGGCWECLKFFINPGTKWMTVTGYTYNPWGTWLPIPDASGPATFDWTLRLLRPDR